MKKVMAVVLIDKDNCISFWERNNIPHFLVIPSRFLKLSFTKLLSPAPDFVSVGLFQQLKVSMQHSYLKAVGDQFFSSLFNIALLKIKHGYKSFMNQNQTCPCSIGSWLQIEEKKYISCTKISKHQQLNAWRMEITTCT